MTSLTTLLAMKQAKERCSKGHRLQITLKPIATALCHSLCHLVRDKLLGDAAA